MLSIDVTDRQVKIISGVFSGKKAKIYAAATQELPTGLIVNGVVLDAVGVASGIRRALKFKKIREKEAVVSISSNLIVFKELRIPKAKPDEFSVMVNNQMQYSMGINDEYSVSYTVMGDIDVGGVIMQRVLAIACPQKLVTSYKQLFNAMGIKLQAVHVSCSCIRRILLADGKYRDRMPLLLVQMDRDFINLNVYDREQLIFTKYVKIESGDYASGVDYVTTASAENIFRMLQFYRSPAIKEVVVYGDIQDIISLTGALDSLDVKLTTLETPSNIVDYESLDFLLYANAIGALYKNNKLAEHTNLLEIRQVKTSKKKDSFGTLAVLIIILCGLMVGGAYYLLSLRISDISSQTDSISAYLNSPEMIEKLAELDKKTTAIDKLRQYAQKSAAADLAFSSKPKLRAKSLKTLEDVMNGEVAITSVTQDGEKLTVAFTATSLDAPAAYVHRVENTKYFDSILYTGYQGGASITFTLELLLKGGDVQ